jgi:hypothetical protein
MKLPEAYLGVAFTISDKGHGLYAWAIHPPMNVRHPNESSGTVVGGQNEAILAARKAIGFHLNVPRGVGCLLQATTAAP